MKFRHVVMMSLAVAATAVLLCWVIPHVVTTYALADRTVELVFVVADAETQGPIPNASIDLMTEDFREKGLGQQVIKLVTDHAGRARFLHANNSCEDVIRPFRKTVTLIDLTWATVNVSATGYSPVEEMWLHTAKYEDQGFFSEGQVQRVEFTVLLHKRAGN